MFIPWTRGNGHGRFTSLVVAGRGRVHLELARCRVGRLSLAVDPA